MFTGDPVSYIQYVCSDPYMDDIQVGGKEPWSDRAGEAEDRRIRQKDSSSRCRELDKSPAGSTYSSVDVSRYDKKKVCDLAPWAVLTAT